MRCIFSIALATGLSAIVALAAGAAGAGEEMRYGGKLLLTGGVSTIEGSGGGGLATWAVVTGYETRDGIAANIHATYAPLSDFELRDVGVAVGLFDRVELSYAHQAFDTQKAGAALGLGRGFTFRQDVVGAKLRLFGDAVYAQDSWVPQVAAGFQFKRNDQGPIVRAVGGKSDQGVDLYMAATKLYLAQSLLLSGAVRYTRANQTGLLGFGGDRRDGYSPQFEGSAAYLINRRLAAGVECRTKPDNLGFAREDAAYDVFAAYALTKALSITAAYVDLGDIATFRNQRGAYVSLQAGF